MMRVNPNRRLCRLAVFTAATCGLYLAPLAGSPAQAAKPALSIAIVGNHFVNGAGDTIRLLGVDRTSSEYACVDGYAYDDGHYDNADAAAIRSWGADAVRIPLNEDCWLGINGQPNSSEGANPALTQAGYQQQIESYVSDLNAHGIYAILDLHWTAPGTQVALEQQPMPDEDHSPAFWTSVASTFKNNPAVVFDLFNEPYDPTDPRSGDDQNSADKVSWNCWDTGTELGAKGGANCSTAAYNEGGTETTTYQVAGLQTLVTAVRDAGAKQPVMIGGLDYANDLGENDHGRAWLDHEPKDPLDQVAASFHNYMGKGCDVETCWKGVIAPVAAHVPVVTGEFDEDNFDEAKCGDTTPSTFDESYMNWADSAGVSYLAWGWIVLSHSERDAGGCGAFYLIDNYSNYTPSEPNGVAVHDHLRALAIAQQCRPPVKLAAVKASVKSHGTRVHVTLKSPQTCNGTLSGKTVHSYSSGGHKPREISLGKRARFSLSSDQDRTVVLTLSKSARQLLARHRSVKVRFTIMLNSSPNAGTLVHRTVTLKR